MNNREVCCLILDKAARILLGGVFVYAAWEKVQDPAMFATMVAGYKFLPAVLINLFALVLPMVELVAGVALIVTKWPRESTLVIFGMLCMFMVGLIQAAIRGLDISCGCFGEEEGSGSIVAAMARDVLLYVPAVWLLLRPNGWIWQFRVRRAAYLAALPFLLLLAAPALAADPAPATDAKPAPMAASPSVATNAVVVEKWTRDFPQVLRLARENHRPVLMFEGQHGCIYCQRLRNVFRSPAFGKWIVGTGIYLVSAERKEVAAHPDQKATHDFLNASPHEGEVPNVPRVGVYWPRASNDEVRVVFEGKRGKMPASGQESLIAEVTTSLELLLKDHFAAIKDRKSLTDTLNMTARRYAAACEGEGTVTMEPASGLLKDDGSHLVMTVNCSRDMEVQGWRRPDGKWLRHRPNQTRLKITYDMPPGTYTAVLRERVRHGGARARSPKRDNP